MIVISISIDYHHICVCVCVRSISACHRRVCRDVTQAWNGAGTQTACWSFRSSGTPRTAYSEVTAKAICVSIERIELVLAGQLILIYRKMRLSQLLFWIHSAISSLGTVCSVYPNLRGVITEVNESKLDANCQSFFDVSEKWFYRPKTFAFWLV